MIDGVIITDLKKIPDERGAIFHMLRKNDKHFIEFGEIYFSIAYPGIIKGWYEHKKQIQNYAVIEGMIKLVLFDNRKKSKSYRELQEIYLGEMNYKLITIPTGIITSYKCIGYKKSILANCSTIPHDPNEMINYKIGSKKIPYSWKS